MSIQRLSNAGQSGFRYKSLIAGITPVASVPVIGEATALTSNTASVTFTAPGAYAAATFTATSSPGGFTGTSATSPITVTGLSELTAYTFTVTATNATGTSGPSAATSSITTPAAFAPDSGYDSLATVSLSTTASSITFTGIPSGYKHLQIRGMALSNLAESNMRLRFNSDSGSNYARHNLGGNGAGGGGGTFSTATANESYAFIGLSPNSTQPGVCVVDILDYQSTSKNKTVRSLYGDDKNGGTGYIILGSGLWINTGAITSIELSYTSTSTFSQYSQFALYGVK
jgi:hypothetical protein